ncbi:MAG: nucleotide sugar dehydrogenase [Rhodospirillales bacterium]|jgi:UDP-N-acetyl-D-glucosamine dehydrogenase|nr:nucleotide sugar dehydrogenase [Rhodospirillales bacterium]
MDSAAIVASFRGRTAIIGVIGLGYVGLPLALTFASKGFSVVGFDVDPAKIAALAVGRSYLGHIPDSAIAAAKTFSSTTDFARLAGMAAIIICVPTPLEHGSTEPDMTYVVKSTEVVATYLRSGQLVVLESTTYPGTTREVMKPILEKTGLVSGRDFLLAYSPEREDPGNPDFGTARIPKVVGGDGDDALAAAVAMYDQVVVRTVPVSSVDVAEAVKITENMFRAVNIALVNELKVVYARMGIDVWEVIDAAKSKPFGFMPFYPGPGWGGHCIPIDPFYLSWRARQFGVESRFVELAGDINTHMPSYVIAALESALLERFGKTLSGARILLLGVAYKKNVDDTRESPAYRLIEDLEAKGAKTDFYDPHVPAIPKTREHGTLAGRRSIVWDAKVLAGYDAALICTDHDAVDYDRLADASRLIIDTRNAMKNCRENRDKVVKA